MNKGSNKKKRSSKRKNADDAQERFYSTMFQQERPSPMTIAEQPDKENQSSLISNGEGSRLGPGDNEGQ